MSSDDRSIYDKIDSGYYYAPLTRVTVPSRPHAPAWHRKVNDVYPVESKAYAEALHAHESASQRYKAAEAERTRRQAELDAEFKRDVLARIGLADHPKADALYQLAYQRGHSNGHHEVLSEAEDLAELLR